jgi:hypothetical protein
MVTFALRPLELTVKLHTFLAETVNAVSSRMLARRRKE